MFSSSVNWWSARSSQSTLKETNSTPGDANAQFQYALYAVQHGIQVQ